MPPTHSALIITVPPAEPAVATHRARYDRAATWGIPAHITVLWPFLPPAHLDTHALTTLARLTAAIPTFTVTLDRINWFDRRVVWLVPEPAAPFRTLTTTIAAHFPQAQPYEGAHTDVVPHLTLGHDHPAADLRAAAAQVQPHLPIHARITTLRLITGNPEPGRTWTTHTEFPLGPA